MLMFLYVLLLIQAKCMYLCSFLSVLISGKKIQRYK